MENSVNTKYLHDWNCESNTQICTMQYAPVC
jgi:hypothetical protein